MERNDAPNQARNGPHPGGAADWQSAVSRIVNPQAVRTTPADPFQLCASNALPVANRRTADFARLMLE